MKYYSTTTSERASKGQGGNKYLNIDINIGEKSFPRFRIILEDIGIDVYKIRFINMEREEELYCVTGIIEKDKTKCLECKYNKDKLIVGCASHYKEAQKGKSQKGESYTLGECIICDTPLRKDKTCPMGC